MARRHGISAKTVRKRRKRGAPECLDRSAHPHWLPWQASEEERAIFCSLRRAINFSPDHPSFVVLHFLPHLDRDSIWRILNAEQLMRRVDTAYDAPTLCREAGQTIATS